MPQRGGVPFGAESHLAKAIHRVEGAHRRAPRGELGQVLTLEARIEQHQIAVGDVRRDAVDLFGDGRVLRRCQDDIGFALTGRPARRCRQRDDHQTEQDENAADQPVHAAARPAR